MDIRKTSKIGCSVRAAGILAVLLAAQPAAAQPPQWWFLGRIHGYYPGQIASISPLELGAEVGLDCRELFGTGLSAGLSCGYGVFFISDPTVQSLSLGTALLSVGYRLPLDPGGGIALSPQAAVGVALVFSESSAGPSNGLQLIGALGVRVHVSLGRRLDLELNPAYRLTAEAGGTYHGATCSLGLSYRLSGDSDPAVQGEVPSPEQAPTPVVPMQESITQPKEWGEVPSQEETEQALAPLAAYSKIRVVRSTDRLRLILEGSFGRNQVGLDPATVEQLRQVSALIVRLKPRRLLIEGFVAEDQDAATDQAVSAARAQAVGDWLVSRPSVGEARPPLEIRGQGRANPVATGTGEAEQARNRRVEITLLWVKE